MSLNVDLVVSVKFLKDDYIDEKAGTAEHEDTIRLHRCSPAYAATWLRYLANILAPEKEPKK